MKKVLLLLLALVATPALAQTPTTPAIAAMVCANNTVVPTPVNGQFFYVQCDSNGKLITTASADGTVTSVAVANANGVSATGSNCTGACVLTFSLGAITPTSVNGNTITTGTGTLTLGSVTLNAGAGGTLGSNAFTSTAYLPLTAGSGQSLTGALFDTQTIAAVSTDGVVLQNTTAAAVNAQQWSPRLHFIGQGWKTNSTASSQTLDWIVENQPVQGTTSPSSTLVFSYQVAGGGYKQIMTMGSNGTTNFGGSGIAGNLGVLNSTGSTTLQVAGGAGFLLSSGNTLTWDANAALSGNADTTVSRLSAGMLQVGTTSANALGSLSLANLTATGMITASGSGQLNVAAMTQTSAAQSGTVCYNSGTGAITYDATLGCLTSTMEAKDDWHNITPQEALARVLKMQAGSFTYKKGRGLPDGEQIGLNAQQIETIDTRLVGYRPNGELAGVRYSQASALYPMAIQALFSELKDLKARIH